MKIKIGKCAKEYAISSNMWNERMNSIEFICRIAQRTVVPHIRKYMQYKEKERERVRKSEKRAYSTMD